MKTDIKPLVAAIAVSVASGCAAMGSMDHGKGSVSSLIGPGVTNNHTPYTVGLVCIGNEIRDKARNKIRIAVGDIPDLTGKIDAEDGGYRVTQGATAMAISALGKLNAVRIVERSKTDIFEFELDLSSKKVLGDGHKYRLPNETVIDYRPVKTGVVQGSDFFITGAISELNFNISSGGISGDGDGMGAGMRQYVMNVAGDFRIVDSVTLEIVKTETLQKQIVGYETDLGVFRFFGSTLLDINTGNKMDEPLQLGVRALIEHAVGTLVGGLYNIHALRHLHNAEAAFAKDGTYSMRYPHLSAGKVCPVQISESE